MEQTDYILRQDVFKLTTKKNSIWDAVTDASDRGLTEIINSIPAADVRPVVHGDWQGEADGYADGELVYDMWSCSACGAYFEEWDERPPWNFCPNCGADMRPTRPATDF